MRKMIGGGECDTIDSGIVTISILVDVSACVCVCIRVYIRVDGYRLTMSMHIRICMYQF